MKLKTELFTRDQVIELIEESRSEKGLNYNKIKSKLKVNSGKVKALLMDKDIVEINIKNVSVDLEPMMKLLFIEKDGSFEIKHLKFRDMNEITEHYSNGVDINPNLITKRYYNMSLYHRVNIIKIGKSISIDLVKRTRKNRVIGNDLNYIKFKHTYDGLNTIEISTIGHGHLRDVYESICKYSDTTDILDYGNLN